MSLRLASPPPMTRFATSMARARSCPDAAWTSSERWGGLGGASMRRYHEFHGRRNPAELGPEHVTAFLDALATRGHVAASTQNHTLPAFLFLYSGSHSRVTPLAVKAQAARRAAPR